MKINTMPTKKQMSRLMEQDMEFPEFRREGAYNIERTNEFTQTIKDMELPELIADLRNKLSPIKNYFATQRIIENERSKEDRGFLDGVKEVKLQELLEIEKLKCETCLAQIEYIISKMENK